MWQLRPGLYGNRTAHDPAGSAPSSVIQSIQQGTITMAASAATGTWTIPTAITVANSILIWGGRNTDCAGQTTPATETARIAITNTTTITATRGASASFNLTVNFTVVEFSSGVNSIQAGTIAITTGNLSATATISSVGATAFVLWQGASSATAAASWSMLNTAVTLTSNTVVTALQGVSLGVTTTIGYMVVDLGSSIVNTIEQRVVTSTAASATDTDTITSVDGNNTLLMYGGATSAHAGTNVANSEYNEVLTSGTLVTFTRSGLNTASRSHYYTVVTFAAAALNGSVQRGVIALVAAASNTATLGTSVDTAKSFVNWGGMFPANADNANIVQSTLVLTSGTVVTAALNAAGTQTTGYAVIQFD